MGRTSTLFTTGASAAAIVAALVFVSAVPSSLLAQAAGCTVDAIPAAVDATGAQLRTYTMQTQPQLQPRLKALSAKNGWGDEGYEEAAYNHLRDAKLEQLDKTSNELLARIDQLGEVKPGEAPDCARLDGIKAAGVELLAVMKAKTAHVMGKIDAELGAAPATAASSTPLKPTILPDVPTAAPATAGPAAAAPATPPPTQAAPPSAPRVAAQPPVASSPAATPAKPPATTPASRPVAEAPPPVRKPSPAGAEGWQTKTSQPPSQQVSPPTAPSQPSEITVAVLPPVPPLQPPLPGGQQRPDEGLRATPPVDDAEDGYTIDEIREASRGVFGNLSTGLASVIEHAFRRSGRPTGYILGTEAGGAFFGGLRYGSGTLYLRRGGTQKVYWHGPSLGFDFGASGTRTIFLVYKISEPEDLYRTFSGLDGSAFAVGGVGITLLGGGNMVLAPIRSGLGLRLGASIGYLRFTPTQTWNPL
ncbi:MAG: DUF1134 domain-containing protein [Hyphomicrobium aestuarii]|nr:DUF1134 domain-containing protein [Hyphomicrobium aestuarii]